MSSKFLLLWLFLLLAQFFLFLFSPTRFPSATCLIRNPLQQQLKVYVADLPRGFNYGLLHTYCKDRNYSSSSCSTKLYPEDPLVKQHSAEFWLLEDLFASSSKNFVRVADSSQADVIFVPFFAALSAQIQLRGRHRGEFRKASAKNLDFHRQQRVIDLVTSSPEWRRSSGFDHVFLLSDPMAMWHFRDRVSTAVFLLVDFGGWYMEDAKNKPINSSIAITVVQHTQVSPIKDVIIPHTHLLPTLNLVDDKHRSVLLYFRGARHRHRQGLVREKLWSDLENEPDVVLEEGLPDEAGLAEATRGMRSSHFCLDPAGDTPSSCRLYDAIVSLCIPVIVSDGIHLPFEGSINYNEFCIFVSARDAARPGMLVQKLRGISHEKRKLMREELSRVQRHFEYEIGGKVADDGAVRMIWSGIYSKVSMIKESIARSRRNNKNGSMPSEKRCHCVS